jgi:DNA polymerase-1
MALFLVAAAACRAALHTPMARTASLVVQNGLRSRALCASTAAVDGSSDGLCLIDGHALAYRMHYALQKTGMSTSDGRPSHAVHGFCFKLLDLHEIYPRHRMLVAFDLPGPTFRSDELSSYKATRPPMPPQLRPQIDAMRDACESFGIPAVSAAGFEADDVIATCVGTARSERVPSVVIVTSDKDMMQLLAGPEAGTCVSMWNDQKKKLVDPEAVEAQFGVRPEQMGDLLALMGDSSDNVPGVPGIGPKGAAKLLSEHGDLEGVLAAASSKKPSKRTTALLEHADDARRAREVVRLRMDVPIEPDAARGRRPDFSRVQLTDFLQEWELGKVEAKVAKLRKGD